MSQPVLPPESARLLAWIARELAEIAADLAARHGVPLLPERRARIIDLCLLDETRDSRRALSAMCADATLFAKGRILVGIN